MIKVFSIRLKQARLMKNLSMDKLCEKIGVSKQSIYKYENAQMMPDSRTLLALSNALTLSFPNISQRLLCILTRKY